MIESAILLLINKIKRTKEGFSQEDCNNLLTNIPISWIIISLVISIGTAYIAFMCNSNSTPATRFIVTIFAFLFSGLYLIYYFIVHILLFYPCGSAIATVAKKIKSKR
jgi:hypothetical protein